MSDLWNEYDPVSRTWWVSPAFFAYMQEQTALDPKWAEKFIYDYGIGPVTVQVIYDHERR